MTAVAMSRSLPAPIVAHCEAVSADTPRRLTARAASTSRARNTGSWYRVLSSPSRALRVLTSRPVSVSAIVRTAPIVAAEPAASTSFSGVVSGTTGGWPGAVAKERESAIRSRRTATQRSRRSHSVPSGASGACTGRRTSRRPTACGWSTTHPRSSSESRSAATTRAILSTRTNACDARWVCAAEGCALASGVNASRRTPPVSDRPSSRWICVANSPVVAAKEATTAPCGSSSGFERNVSRSVVIEVATASALGAIGESGRHRSR